MSCGLTSARSGRRSAAPAEPFGSGDSRLSDEGVLRLLRDHDDPVRAEAPAGFRREAAESEFEAFANTLTAMLGSAREIETGVRIQDASFHGDIRFPESLVAGGSIAGVRVSNFGRFCCVYDSDADVQPSVLDTVRQVASQCGYVFVPSRVLDLPYHGRNPGVSGFETWGQRFFDYI